jgi:amino acid transporter
VFADNLRGGIGYGSLFDQVKGTMLVTVFVFLGVEGASVYSRHAKRREDVGRATILGFLSVFAIFASVTIVTYGVLPASEIAELRQPSMAGVLESVAAVAYAAVTGLTLYASGHLERRVSPQAGMILDRVAGILLTSIAVILLANGFTDLVVAALGRG